MTKRHSVRISMGALVSLFVLFMSGCASDDTKTLVDMDSAAESANESDQYGALSSDDIGGVEEEEEKQATNSNLFKEFEGSGAKAPMEAPKELASVSKPTTPKMHVSTSPKIPDEAIGSNGSLLNRFYFVRKSDTPHIVSQLLFGSTDKAKQIFDLAGGLKGWKVGTVIYYQSTDKPTDRKMKSFYAERNVKSQVYKVKKGDQLTSIANELYGDQRSWVEIAILNRMADPTTLEEGQTLVLSAADLKPYSQQNWELASQTSREEVKKLLANMEKPEMRAQQASAGISGFLRQNWLFVGSVFVIAAAALMLLVVLPKKAGY